MSLRLFLAILTLVLIGCVSQPKKPNNYIFSDVDKPKSDTTEIEQSSPPANSQQQNYQQITPPTWYTNSIPEHDKNILLGYGEGSSTEDAINNALGNITQQLETTVSAYTEIQTSLSNSDISKNISEKVSSSSKSIVISDYKVLNREQSQDRYYVLIEINKPKSIAHLKKSILHKNVEQQNIQLTDSSLNNFKTAEYMSNELLYLKNAIMTLYLLDDTINLQPYFDVYHSYSQKLTSFKKNIKIHINNDDDSYLLKTLKEYLRLKYKLTINVHNANIEVSLHNSDFDEFGDVRGSYNISTKVTVQAQDTYTKIITKAEYSIKAHSNKGRQAAIDKACQIFYAQLTNSEDIFSQG